MQRVGIVGQARGAVKGLRPLRATASCAARRGRPSAARRVTRMQALPNNGSGSNANSSNRKGVQLPKAAMAEPEVNFSEEDVAKTKAQLMAELDAPPAGFSGLMGKALVLEKKDFPTVAEINATIPEHCKVLDTKKSMAYFFMSTGICLGLGLLAHAFIPKTMAFLPAWLAYAAANGTAMFGFWLHGHEAGHFAFSNNLLLQDIVGYISHTCCLTPYFSWQRSHAVHHSKVNHMWEGESHVPKVTGDGYAMFMRKVKNIPVIGNLIHGLWSAFVVSVGKSATVPPSSIALSSSSLRVASHESMHEKNLP